MHEANQFQPDGHVVIVLGAGTDIGHIIAEIFALAGAVVLVIDPRLDTAQAVSLD